MDDKKKTDSDRFMCGQDYFTAGRVAAEHGNEWEKAAHRYVSSPLSGLVIMLFSPRLVFVYNTKKLHAPCCNLE
jgi:hypothetical protein